MKKKKRDAGPPVKLAVAVGITATVSEVDWGHAYHFGEWSLRGGVPYCGRTSLGRYVADRMGLDRNISVAFKDGNPLNCTRENVFVTTFVWQDGYRYGNVRLVRDADRWTLIHTGSGHRVGASWSTLKRARAAVEMIHAERNLTHLDSYERFREIDNRRWRATISKYREKP